MRKYRKVDEQALNNVNYFQGLLKDAQGEINKMKGDLGRAGFKVRFETIGGIAFDGVQSSVPATVNCKISKKKTNEVIVQTKAEAAKDDFDIKILGKYLALARASRMILGDYIEIFTQN